MTDAHLTTGYFSAFWSSSALEINLLVFLNLLGALVLGLLVGYERSYHGRAAGMRTYGLVCMASAALTVFAGFPSHWWGGVGTTHFMGTLDPTRVVQGIVTGIGFLGAGVIMKEGLNISGLTTAASIWASSAIGVLVGVGFYAAAILLAGLSASLMMWGAKMEGRLPSRRALGVTLAFHVDFDPQEAAIKSSFRQWGYAVAEGSLSIAIKDSRVTWTFVMVALESHPNPSSLFELSRLMQRFEGVEQLHITHARN